MPGISAWGVTPAGTAPRRFRVAQPCTSISKAAVSTRMLRVSPFKNVYLLFPWPSFAIQAYFPGCARPVFLLTPPTTAATTTARPRPRACEFLFSG